jgi:GTP-binding protein
MFVDRIKVFAKAGDGGRGCVSFRREKFVPRGGPDGGDGGRGGDVVLVADEHTDNLANLFYEPIIKAKNGVHGQGKKMHGKAAPPKVVKVPVGTVVYRGTAPGSANGDAETSLLDEPSDSVEPAIETQPESLSQIADLLEHGQEFVLCRGGRGGKGNVHFKSSKNRAPREYTEGDPGEEGHYLLELRTIADVGLIGYPNAGKSTLLRRISAAHPKVAAYPFTTLHPIIGIVEFPGFRRATVADIPGLIEGAHENVGLGHDFLRHITRCRLLLFVLDIAGSENRNPLEDLQNLRRELDLYDERLSQRPWRVVANKMDLAGAGEYLADFQKRFPDIEAVPVSAGNGEGIPELKTRLAEWLSGGRLESEKHSYETAVNRIAE